MSDSSYFDDTLDSEFLDEVDALETEQQLDIRVSALDMDQPTPPESFGNTNDASSARARAPSCRSPDSFGEVFDLDDLQEIDNTLARPISGPSNPSEVPARTASKTLQTTLWSGLVLESHTKSGATCRTQPTRGRTPKVKIWDKTAFAKSAWRSAKTNAKAKAKGKGRANVDKDEGGEEALTLDTPDIPECISSESSDLLSYFSDRSPNILLTVEYASLALP
jgi:hypothetical protein